MTRDWRARMIDPGLARSLLFVADPRRWPLYPVLPLVRRSRGREECGCRVDVRGLFGVTGFSATVFLENAFVIPLCFTRLLALPRESYDSAEALLAGGWRVD